MDDSGPVLRPNASDLGKMKQKGMGQGSVAGAHTGMDDHPCGFIDDDDMLVGIKDMEGDIFGVHLLRLRHFHIRLDPIPFSQLVARLFQRAVDPHPFFIDEPLELRSRIGPDLAGQKDIQPFSLPESRRDMEIYLRHVDVF